MSNNSDISVYYLKKSAIYILLNIKHGPITAAVFDILSNVVFAFNVCYNIFVAFLL